MKLKYNSTQVDRSKETDFTPPKPGVYRMKVAEVKYERENDRLVIVSRMLKPDSEGNGKGYGFWDRVPMDLDWKLDNWLLAMGVDTINNPEGEFDPSKWVGNEFMGRVKEKYYTPEGESHPQYRPELGKVMPLKGDADEDDDEADDEIDQSEFEEDDDLGEDDEPAFDYPTPDEVTDMGGLADEGDEECIAALDALGRKLELDPDEYATWGELAEAIVEVLPEQEVEKPKPVKATAKKAAAKPKPEPEPEPDDEDEDEEAEDYESWDLGDLKAEAESRGLSSKGSKTAIIARLREADADPFA